MSRRTWTLAEAEAWLLELELFGMHFGLDRVRALLGELGDPQARLRCIHVVGSNGKSSTTRLTAAILEAHGVRTGAYLSPHLASFAERVRIAGADIGKDAFAASLARAADATQRVNARGVGGEPVTQFEALTAAAFDALASADVSAAVIEAGLGGRFDATNAITSEVQVLTNVSLEHTRWLGTTITQIAAEKLDVVERGGVLVIGEDLDPAALAVAERVCADRGARIVRAHVDSDLKLAARGGFQRQNFALACAAAEALRGHQLDHGAVVRAGAQTLVPGRFEVVSADPVTVFDGAHNAAGMAALLESLPALVAGRRLVACVSILDDKDAVGLLADLAGRCDDLIVTTAQNPRATDAAVLASALAAAGIAAQVVPGPHVALRAARASAGRGGVVLVTGSLYLLADLLRSEDAPRGSIL